MARRSRRIKGEGSIFQRADGRWVAQYGKKTKYAKNALDAKDKLRDLIIEAESTENLPAQTHSVSDVSKLFLAMKSVSLKGTSFDRLEATFNNQIIPRIGNINIQDITYFIVKEQVLDTMFSEELSYSSIKKAYDGMNACLNYAKVNNMIASNPFDGHDSPKKSAYQSHTNDEDGIVFAFDVDNRKLFIAAATSKYSTGNYRYPSHNAFIFDMYTGLRMGELIGLRWKNVDLSEHSICVREAMSMVCDRNIKSSTFGKKRLCHVPYTKNNQPRTLKLNDNAYRQLLLLKNIADKKGSDYVVSNRHGAPISPATLESTFTSICNLAGLTLPNSCRLKHATQMDNLAATAT